MRKYEVKGYVIVHGQNIKVIEQNVFAERSQMLLSIAK